ncbi:FAD-dependent oxidoreductase [Candidatus Bathyarchaeota archaeon]|nr:FAD-dependent oxidoreductase [Candidatus Bathyarchaeota archaeon]
MFCAGTYHKILASIAKPALEKADVKLVKVVSRISRREGRQGKVRVQTRKEEVFEFDHVVLTAPLGWLKNNLDAFEPPLPPRMTSAIASLGYGCLEKVSGPVMSHTEGRITLRAVEAMAKKKSNLAVTLDLHHFPQGVLERQ